MMARENSNETVERLKDIVEMHQVCYEVWPELLIVKGQQLKVGFDLELVGTHEHGTSTFSPGCPRCLRTFEDLRQIAEWIMPKEERPSRYEIEPYDRALHESAQRKFVPEVVLRMTILHRHGFDQPVDECEERCLKEMRGKLSELGVRAGEWRPTKSQVQRNALQ
jgi:hypothetical protein